MNLLPLIVNMIPGISPQWKQMIAESSRALDQYQNTRQDLLKAITDRNLRPDDIRQGLNLLNSKPVASILNTIRPGSVQQLHNLFSSIADEADKGRSAPQGQAAPHIADKRRENPFPALNQ